MAARRHNLTTRLLHHHVFVTESLLRLVAHCDLEIRAVHPRIPHDIFCLARRPLAGADPPDNSAWVAPDAPWRRRSPFARDRGEPGRS